MFEGTFLEKTKEKDFFGFDKVGKSIKSGMDIMFRKNLGLEQRVMKRDKKNQQGLIGSFMTAYSQEAKQEELPLMERQVRAILELKATISGDQKIRQAAWEKMLYEHPVFHASYLAAKGTIKTFTAPFKFLFKKRGRYANQLTNKGTAFERMVDAGAQTYQGLMTKMDDVIHNLFLIANSTSKNPKGEIKARKAPGQPGYSIAGKIAKFAYKNMVQRPAAAIGWAAKKLGSKSETWTNKRTVGDVLGDSWKETKKNYGEHWQRRGKRAKILGEMALPRTDWSADQKKAHLKKTKAEYKEFVQQQKDAEADKKSYKKKVGFLGFGKYEPKHAEIAVEKEKIKREKERDAELKKSLAEKRKAGQDKYHLDKKDPWGKKQRDEKELGFSSGGKDRSGKKTIVGRIADMVSGALF
jgi:hypothetical protein